MTPRRMAPRPPACPIPNPTTRAHTGPHPQSPPQVFFYASLVSRSGKGKPRYGVSPDRMEPWVLHYGPGLLTLNKAQFARLYIGHTLDRSWPLPRGEGWAGPPAVPFPPHRVASLVPHSLQWVHAQPISVRDGMDRECVEGSAAGA